MSEANRDEWSVYAPKLLCGAIRKNCIAPTWLSDLRISVFRPEITNGLRLGEGRALKTVSPNIAQMLKEVQMFNYFR